MPAALREAHISRPRVVLGKHPVNHDEYMEQVLSRFSEDQRRGAKARTAQLLTSNLGVETQHLSRPLRSPAVTGGGTAAQRAEATLTDVVDMGTDVIEAVLADTGVDRLDIDALVVSNVTHWGSPGISSHLRQRAGLRRDIDKIEMNSLACAGGAAAFARAFDYIAAYPDRKVLVVVPERLSTITHGDDKDPMDITYGWTFSDGAAGSMVSGYRQDDSNYRKSLGPGMVITHRHEFELPGTLTYYYGEEDHRGKHFRSDKRAPGATREIIPEVLLWMKRQGIPAPEWVALHPGSAKIIRIMAEAFNIDPALARYSYASLRGGNRGAAAVLDVLARTFDEPPADGAPGLLAAVGPGVNFVTCTGYFTHG